MFSQYLNTAFTLKDCLFGAANLTKNNEPDSILYWVLLTLIFLMLYFRGKNVIFLENSSSVPTDTRKKMSFGECPAQGLDDTSITAEAKFSINFTESGKCFVLSLSYNGNNKFVFVNAANYINSKQNTMK